MTSIGYRAVSHVPLPEDVRGRPMSDTETYTRKAIVVVSNKISLIKYIRSSCLLVNATRDDISNKTEIL